MDEKLTLAGIKDKCPPHRGIVAKFEDKIAYPLTWIFLKLHFSANMVSLLMPVLCILGCVLFYFQNYYLTLSAILLFIIADTLDYVDGNIARYTNISSSKGELLDLIHHILENSLFFVGFGFFFYNQNPTLFYISIITGFNFLMMIYFTDSIPIVLDLKKSERKDMVDRMFRKFPIGVFYSSWMIGLKFVFFGTFLFGLGNYLIWIVFIHSILRIIIVPIFVIMKIDLCNIRYINEKNIIN